MAKFVIEGTVSELEVADNKYIFKMCGTEGYSVNRGEKNIIFSGAMKINYPFYHICDSQKKSMKLLNIKEVC